MKHCSQKKNDKHSQVLLVFRKNHRKWKTCSSLIVGILERICCFNELFLMALTSTEHLFTEKPLYILFLHNDNLFPATCVKLISLQYYRLYNFPSARSSYWRCSVRIGVRRNFAKFSGKHLWQSLFFNKVAGWGDCFWSFSCLLLKILCLFDFNRKMKWKKRNTMMKFKYLIFCSSIDLFHVKDFKRNLAYGNLIRKCV